MASLEEYCDIGLKNKTNDDSLLKSVIVFNIFKSGPTKISVGPVV